MCEESNRSFASETAPQAGKTLLRLSVAERGAAAELRVIGEEHVAHAASPELAANDISSELQTHGDRIHANPYVREKTRFVSKPNDGEPTVPPILIGISLPPPL